MEDLNNRLAEIDGTLAGIVAMADGYRPEKAEIADVLTNIAHAAESARRDVQDVADELPRSSAVTGQ